MKKKGMASGRIFFLIFICFLVLGAGLAYFGHWEMSTIKATLNQYHVFDKASLEDINVLLKSGVLLFWQVLGGCLIITALFFWLTLRFAVKKSMHRTETQDSRRSEEKVKISTPGLEVAHEDKDASLAQRRALHLLSLLQREGRLVDFLEEDLEAYDDAQIGVAVRGIQENCKKSLKKYVAPGPVIGQDEGEQVTVPTGFDPTAIKLTGNVSGNPPFKGILQHRGWRAGHQDLPTLSGSQSPDIIAPAEVEIP